jgi:hypothetical protein
LWIGSMIDVNRCTLTIALAHARKAVKEEVWARGGKPHHMAMSVIQRMARDYLVDHPELIAEARPIAEEMHQQHQRKLAWQRELRGLRRCANLASAAQKSEPCETTTIPVQILGAE